MERTRQHVVYQVLFQINLVVNCTDSSLLTLGDCCGSAGAADYEFEILNVDASKWDARGPPVCVERDL